MVAGIAAATVLSAPGTAAAAENTSPARPLVKDLLTGGKACAAGEEARSYVSAPPRLSAVLYDPDRTQVSGEFEVWWTDAEGAEQRRTYTTTAKLSGTTFTLQLPSDITPTTVVSWRVRANDGTAASPWSSEGEGSVCEFVYDDVNPEKATIASPEYPQPEDVFWVDGVGVYGHFTMDSPSDDVVAYTYGFIGGPYGTVRPEQRGGAVTVPFLPLASGPQTLTVRAIDRAGRSSGQSLYYFNVKSGHAPVSHWKLADAVGATSADAESGTDARAGSGVTFGGAAPAGTGLTTTAHLDGGDQAFLTPDAPAVDTGGTFAVGAWVRPERTDRDMAVASQGSDGATLGLRAGDDGPVWSFTVAGQEISGGAPESGEWAHVLGLYDAETGLAQLYVNGYETGTRTQAAPAGTTGAFRIGQGTGVSAWQGDIGDVRAYDRVVVPAEATELARRKPQLLGHWSLETASDGASPEQSGGVPLRLGAGAVIHRGPDNSCLPEIDPDCPVVPYALVGDGHLQLDGETAYAATDAALLDTADSFTIGVVVRLTDPEPAHPMTVLSQAGEHTDAFKVRYEPSTYSWQLVMPEKDEAGAAETVVAQIASPAGADGYGSRLAIVYDDATDRIKLYLDGWTNATATATLPNGWHSSGPLQVGRAHIGDGWGEYLHGDVDEVHAFSGVLSDSSIRQLGGGAEPCLC
ncbi:LamG domain-containing protein [Streptomyces sp. NBC_00243]|uniref:LamG domain-containing protein n=1 Tax=Streptomyces sp. NBC_00243 TaxID=2975688 RepID=UPI002DDB0122|nr:LamG domain-containing protein [Streptomyces sp. NBC_00243]WRZ25997.1 LamG domain-containing protein [Streptomyces sp. NBC_00243]